jgi:antitoxin PrlF
MPSFEAKLTSKGQVTLPAKVREAMRVDAGDKVVFTQAADGSFHVSAINRSMAALKGIVRAGDAVTGDQMSTWIEQARGRSAPGPSGRGRTRSG